MSEPHRLRFGRAGTSHRKYRIVVRKPFRLNKKILECRMMSVSVAGGDDDFAVTRQLDLVRARGIVCEPDGPSLGSARRKGDNFHFRFDVAIASPEDCPIRVKCDVIPFRLDAHRLVTRRPKSSRCDVIHITPLSVMIERRVASPAIYCDVAEPCFTAARIGDDSCKWNAAQYGDPRLGRMRCVDMAFGFRLAFHFQ